MSSTQTKRILRLPAKRRDARRATMATTRLLARQPLTNTTLPRPLIRLP